MDARALTPSLRRQDGLITLDQLRAAGISRDQLRRAVEHEQLHRVHPRVLACTPVLSHRGRWRAAVLACGPTAVLSHLAAGALHGSCEQRGPVDVTVTDGRRGPRGIAVHRTRHPPRTVRRAGIPVTDPARTLVDLADVLAPERFVAVAMEAEHRRLVRLDALPEIAGRRGGPALARLAAHVRERTRSELEAAVLRLCRDARLPPPRANVRVAGYVVDLCWAAERVVLEADGYAFHHGRAQWERRYARDLALQRAGWRVVHVTWLQVTERPGEVVAALRVALGV